MARAQALLEVLKIAKREGISESEAWRLFRSRVGTARTRKELSTAEARFRKGDRSAIISALYLCAWHDYPLPAWLAKEVMQGCENYILCQARTLDGAYDITRPKGLNVSARGFRMKNADKVFLTVEGIRKGKKLSGDALYAAASDALHMGARQVKEIHQAVKRERKNNLAS